MIIIYACIACQLAAWGWFASRGGELPDKSFLVFTAGMMMGQLGAGVETFLQSAWGTFVVQAYFFCFTAFGGYQRWRKMTKIDNKEAEV